MSGLGLTREDICNVLNISKDTLLRRINDGNEKLAAALKRGTSLAKANVSQRMYEEAISGNTGMIKFYLTHQGGWGKKNEPLVDEYGMPYLSYDEYRKIHKMVELEKELNAARFMNDIELNKFCDAKENLINLMNKAFERMANHKKAYREVDILSYE